MDKSALESLLKGVISEFCDGTYFGFNETSKFADTAKPLEVVAVLLERLSPLLAEHSSDPGSI